MSVVYPPLLIGSWPFPRVSDRAARKQPRIFVAIPSYRDAETQWTVKDLFAKARYPDLIFVGICWQFDAGQDAHCFVEPYPRPDQVRVIEVSAAESRGANWARAQALSLLQDEEYVLMIDAHMRVEAGWDEMLLDMLQQCPSKDAVLTTFPTNYTPPDSCDRRGVKRMAFREFTDEGPHAPPKLRYASFRIPPDVMPSAPFAAASVAHGFMFAASRLFQQVPIDPHIYFFGDELTFAARAWTHGWDFYSPHRPVVFHLWDRTARPRHLQDQPREARQLRQLSAARVAHLVGIQQSHDPRALAELSSYGLGTARTLKEYQRFSGVDFAKRTLAPHALAGRFEEAFAGHAARRMPDGDLATRVDTALPPERIFVAIRSYRDAETQWTIKDLFAKASKPERVNVGVCWQVEPGEDAHCFTEPYPYPSQIRVVGALASQTGGACWAQAQALSLAHGEDYALLIDAHMRFVSGWDEILINLIRSANDEKTLLTAWLPGYSPPDTLRNPPRGYVRQIAINKFSAPGHPSIVHLKGISTLRERLHALNATPFLVGNFVFARTNVFDDVPIDPHIRLYGEEVSWSARLWTHGYSLYEPGVTVAYHYWKPREVGALDAYKRRSSAGTAASNQRVRHLLRLEESTNSAALADLDLYALGSARSLESLWRFAGIDPATRIISEHATSARWNIKDAPPHPPIDQQLTDYA